MLVEPHFELRRLQADVLDDSNCLFHAIIRRTVRFYVESTDTRRFYFTRVPEILITWMHRNGSHNVLFTTITVGNRAFAGIQVTLACQPLSNFHDYALPVLSMLA